ncbi:hypothetical protein EVAR_14753_1 [Eumeta japonica]|uniref:Uncharacterized protein n=1 Tax=Eumeta variegata TaxID=151549 RepID=A0A4C1TWJ6_EUMVA|nr:hypothetical protein EVAR_14753_1 [Eumeta japonica]
MLDSECHKGCSGIGPFVSFRLEPEQHGSMQLPKISPPNFSGGHIIATVQIFSRVVYLSVSTSCRPVPILVSVTAVAGRTSRSSPEDLDHVHV